MATSDEFRQLLFADVALLLGKAEVRDVAAALQRYWDRRDTDAATVAGELGRLVDLDAATLAEIEAEVGRLVGQAGGDPRRALTMHGGLAGPLERAAPAPVVEVSRAATRLRADLDVHLRPVAEGRYVDFLPVGEGGMGIVYWAVDSELKRQVAFKVVRPPTAEGRPDVTPPAPFALAAPDGETEVVSAFDELTARFLQEAWVTGGMEHPGIVPVYELGRTEAGVPYYTMKFVRGSRTLATAIAEARGRPLEDRLELLEPFLKVCDTIRYAHSRRVVHRDLKPDNVALGEFGEVVVLDWGLAKLQGEAESDLRSRWQGGVRAFRDSTELRTVSSAVGTPGYMAPEAAQGLTEVIDERSDVYSLGAMLFEVLTGRRPFEFRHFREYQEQVVDRDAPDAREVDADVPEALAGICAGALARSRAERTARVDDLARDVRAWQAQRTRDREIEAHLAEADAALASVADLAGDAMLRQVDRATVACRRALDLDAGHAGARRRLARADAARERGIQQREQMARRSLLRKVGVTAVAVALVVAGVVAVILEQRRREAENARVEAAQARAQAVEGRAEAERVMGFMVGEMQEQLKPYGRLDLLARLGHVARRYYENLPLEGLSGQSLRNGTIALRNLGDVHLSQGDLPAARKAYDAAQTVAERLVAAEDAPEDAAWHLSLARAKVGGVLIAQGYANRAVDLLEEHLREVRALSEAHPDARDHLGALAQAHATLGRARDQLRDAAGALEHYDAALAIIERLAEDDDASGTWHRERVARLWGAGRALVALGRPEECLRRAVRAEQIARTWRERLPADVRWLRAHAGALRGLGEAHWHLIGGAEDEARFDAAMEALREAAELDARLRAIDAENTSDLAAQAFVALRQGNVLQRWEAVLYEQEVARRRAEGLPTVPHQDPAFEAWARELRLRAAPHWTRAHEIYRRLVELDPTNALWLHTALELCDRMCGVVEADPARGEKPSVYRRRAFEYGEKLRACDPDNPLYRHLYAYTLFQHTCFVQAEDEATARARFEEVLEVLGDLPPAYRAGQGVAVLAGWTAGRAQPLLMAAGQRDRALKVLYRALDLLHDASGSPDHVPHGFQTSTDLAERLAATAEGGSPAQQAAARARLDAVIADLQAARDRQPDDGPHDAELGSLLDRMTASRDRLPAPR